MAKYTAKKMGNSWHVLKDGHPMSNAGMGLQAQARAEERAADLNEAHKDGYLMGIRTLELDPREERATYERLKLKFEGTN